uniref:DNA polymerase subunit gamma-1 n=1 Tax=Photinus pyralis TaxID=7054 RepID=A0A1Y1KQB2_PHOPY
MFRLHKFDKTIKILIHNSFTRYSTEILPRQTKKLYPPCKKKLLPNNDKHPPPIHVDGEAPRVNSVGIQMLPANIYKQVFKGIPDQEYDASIVEKCHGYLNKHGILKKDPNLLPDVNLKIPPLCGANIIEHFEIIAEEQSKPYRELVLDILDGIPPIPEEWVMQVGWTRYVLNQEPVAVDCPLEDCVVFDVEVCMRSGKLPTIATAVSKEAWYGWVSESLMNRSDKPLQNHEYYEKHLIPFYNGSLDNPKVVIGHNVAYDRSRIMEPYRLRNTGMRFLDTMSMHVAINGLTSYQRAVLKSQDKEEEDGEWQNTSSLNSLNEVHKLYCGKEVEKTVRDVFVYGSLNDVYDQFQTVMSYCAYDVKATHNVLKVLFPLYLERFPHPATLAGMLELSTTYLPINGNWERYINNSEQAYDDLDIERKVMLARCADQACHLFHNNKYAEDLWMWDQDWDVKDIKIRKTPIKSESRGESDNTGSEQDLLEEKFNYLDRTAQFLPAVESLLPGYPNWYRKLCTKPGSSPDWVPGPHLISTSMQITPKLLGLTWENYPLHFIRGQGWGLIVPFLSDSDIDTRIPIKQILQKRAAVGSSLQASVAPDLSIGQQIERNLSKVEFYRSVKKDNSGGVYKGSGVWSNTVLENCCWFYKLPHKDGPSHRVGNPLAKDFLNKFSESVLTGSTNSAEKIIAIQKMLSYWRNNRNRIMEQMVVWLDDAHLPNFLKLHHKQCGAILPQVVVCGTLTRRAVEATWMTASNAHTDRVGSELRSMVQAPFGYSIVGADVDSQELWIASVIGDSHFAKIHGGTPLGWMTISGNKSDGTDMHSVTAKAVGISRDQAKVLNYARIYGAGQNFAEQLLKQFNPTMSDSDVRRKSSKMFTLTKGKRVFNLKKEFLTDFPDKLYERWEAFGIAKLHNKKLDEMFYNPKWTGGMESAMFNRLEEIANNSEPVTPFLHCRLSRALEPKGVAGDRFLPTRINWVVQSGAVDFLHLMLVSMRWIMQNQIRFCFSFHDEVRYLVKDDRKYQAALAMHVTNLLVRSYCSAMLGMRDLPFSVAFFSSVEVDAVLRKEAKQDCKTPSNPHGLMGGYNIPNGESLDIHQAVRKAGGQYAWWRTKKRNVESHKTKARPNGTHAG